MPKSQLMIWITSLFVSSLILTFMGIATNNINISTIDYFFAFYIGYTGLIFAGTGVISGIIYGSTKNAFLAMICWTVLYGIFFAVASFGLAYTP